MREYFDNNLWNAARKLRACQRVLGRISGFFLAIALIALFDGLLAEMRQGSATLELVQGSELTVSGPSALKNPLRSDLLAKISPSDSGLVFDLDGFYTGYWFGNGMWRGKIEAPEGVVPGTYHLRVFFKGAAGSGAQNYDLRVFEDAAAMRAASLSFVRRYLDFNPFILAAICGVFGVALGISTYWFGRRFIDYLNRLGLAEIYHFKCHEGKCHVWCIAGNGPFTPRPGNVRMVFTPDGALIGEARAEKLHKGKLMLTMLDDNKVPAGSLVCISPPGRNSQDPTAE